MTHFDLEDLERMAKEEAETEGMFYRLVLHYEGTTDVSCESATTALEDIKEQAKNCQKTIAEMMNIAYICSEEDYEVEQAEIAYQTS